MKQIVLWIFALCALRATPVGAEPVSDELIAAMAASDVVILGEVHDNPDHHVTQADIVRALQPGAVVWEMLTQDQASTVDAELIADRYALADALKWAESGWPKFSMYYPIFAAAPEARVFGGHVPRSDAVEAMKEGAAKAFGYGADDFGLTVNLPETEATQRHAYQMAAHCDALPETMVAGMIDIQRLRDAVLARAAIVAGKAVDGPVVIITGNGHGRADWGIPVYLKRVAPDLQVFSLGQSEDGQSNGTFDAVLDSAAAEREDPCAGFHTKD